jgi:hypothetical protein
MIAEALGVEIPGVTAFYGMGEDYASCHMEGKNTPFQTIDQ